MPEVLLNNWKKKKERKKKLQLKAVFNLKEQKYYGIHLKKQLSGFRGVALKQKRLFFEPIFVCRIRQFSPS